MIMEQLDFGDQWGGSSAVSTDLYDFIPGLFSPEASYAFLERLIAEVPWAQTTITLYGKTVKTPRLTAWFGDSGTDYSIRGTYDEPLPWRDDLLQIKAKVEAVSGKRFNGVLLNYYRDGNDSVSWHSD